MSKPVRQIPIILGGVARKAIGVSPIGLQRLKPPDKEVILKK